MIKETSIEMNITPRNISYYKNLEYECCIGDKINILIKDLNENSHYRVTAICELCKSEKVIKYHKYVENKNRHDYYGCKKCSRKKAEKTNIDLYGEANYMSTEEGKKRVEATMYERYGCKTNLINTEHLEKNKKIMIEKYGVEYPMQSKEVRERSKKTLLYKYGVDSFSKTDTFKQNQSTNSWFKYLKSKLDDYNITDYKLDIENRTVDILCEVCDDYYEINSKNLYQRKIVQNSELCTNCNPLSKSYSNSEKEISDFIKDNYDGNILNNHRELFKGELDIYLPDLSLAFEFNGLYWHSELHKDKNYHLNKTKKCLDKEIQLIHIYEDDWSYKQDIVKSRILNLIGKSKERIYARKCDIRKIEDIKLIRDFLETNHIQGFSGSKVKLGLFHNNELVSLMTFGSLRKNLGQNSKDGDWELLRFCNRLNTNVIGGASKLFKFFTREFKYNSIISYADRSWSKGNLYDKLKFNRISETIPNYHYIINRKRHNRFNYRKDKLISEGFDSNKTEHDIMLERSYYRIYDSGSIKYILYC